MLKDSTIEQAEKTIAGEGRLSLEQGMELYNHASTQQLGDWADAMARRIHGDDTRTYVIDRNINYTNVCSAKCTFCAFKRRGDEDDAYVLAKEELFEKIRELSDIGGKQILLQGGMHPDLPLEFYTDMLSSIKAEFPHIHLHAFSPPEFVEFVAVFEIEGFPTPGPKKSHELDRETFRAKLKVIIEKLRKAGLDSVPGGGGEIFPEHVRRVIGSTKATGEEWLDVMRTSHEMGMFTSSTMMFGHVEGVADRFMHMQMIRDAQDEAINNNWPGRYLSFIAWPFQPENTPLGNSRFFDREEEDVFAGDTLADMVLKGEVDPHDKKACREAVPDFGRVIRLAGATDYLRMQAIGRLFMDNIHSIGSSWVTMGPKIGQIGLCFGANDMGSVMMEENVVSAAGTTYCLNEATICRLIRDAGFIPAERNNRYEIIKEHEDSDSPDLAVTDWNTLRPAAPGEHPEAQPVNLTVAGEEA